MSEKRRRRKGVDDSEGSDLSETEPDKSNKAAGEHGDSEYESADENIANSPKHKPAVTAEEPADSAPKKPESPATAADSSEAPPAEQPLKPTDSPDKDSKDDKQEDLAVKQDNMDEGKPDKKDEPSKEDGDGKGDKSDDKRDKSDEEDEDDVISVRDDENSDEDDEFLDDDDLADLGYGGDEDEDEEEGGGAGEEPFPGSGERQDGDGQETPEPMDDDEDKKNPQYIPKKGMFYEHDDRLGTDEELEDENGVDGEEETKTKKKIWKADAAEKWGHDKFLELDQEPKSKDELVTSYGYDIRNEDNAPRARRRRRYGRGPNKYTRNWEDEDAYTKPAPKQRQAPNKIKDKAGKDVIIEDFPALPGRADAADKPPGGGGAISPLLKDMKPQRGENRRNNRNSADRDIDNKRGRGRGEGGNRSRGRGRGGRGGGAGGQEQSRRGGDKGFGRGGYEDRRRFNERNDRRSNDDDRRPEDEQRWSRGGRSGRGGGGGGGGGGQRYDQHDHRDLPDNKSDNRNQNIEEDLGKIDINRDKEVSSSNPPRGGGGKRYSYQRRGGGEPSSSADQRHLQEMFEEGVNPALCSGPPRGRPFQPPMSENNTRLPHNTMVSNAGVRPVPANFIQTPQMMNYSPQQFGVPANGGGPPASMPMGPPVPVPLTAISALPRNVPAPLLAPGFHNGPPDPVLLAAAAANQAAAAPGPDGFAAVRGGVTYFNPTAQNILLPQRHHVNKRPKAAIPIVDPSIVESRDYAEDMNGHAELA